VLIPFDLATVDSSLAADGPAVSAHSGPAPVVLRLLALCRSYLADPGIVRDMAAAAMARLLTRPDMMGTPLQEFLAWTAVAMATPPPEGTFLVPGAASALAGVLKHGARAALAPAAPALWRQCSSLAGAADVLRSPLLRRLAVKLATRIGLLLLRPKLVSWRYQRGARSLHVTLGGTSANAVAPSTNGDANGHVAVVDDDGDNYDVPEEMEAIFELLLNSLQDSDTVVRWAAAKGVGRITSRLSRRLGDDVVTSVLETFQRPPSGGADAAWHGGCLALAQLATRGTLLPYHLEHVVPAMVVALQYDVRRGPHSVGAHVRDAACYVVWASARAYEPSVLLPHARALAPHLLVLASTDREVNCRRAAAAAFQECVGRLGGGSLIAGITAVQLCDYFSVGTRTGAYLTVVPGLGALDATYLDALMQQLVQHKTLHWDKHLRLLAARSLASLVPLDPASVARHAAQTLLPRTLHADPGTRHGALHALAAVTVPLMEAHRQDEGSQLMSAAFQASIAGAVPALEKARLYRGKGGELVRGGACALLAAVAQARLPVDAKLSAQLLASAHESVSHPYADVQAAAARAIGALVAAYGDERSAPQTALTYARMLKENDNPAARRGAALALAELPAKALAPAWAAVVDACQCASAPEADIAQQDAETRVNAVRALGACVATCGVDCTSSQTTQGDDAIDRLDEEALARGGVPVSAVRSKVVPALLDALKDYCMDSRGDVGSWVREAAMDCLPHVLCAAICDASDAELVTRAVCALLKQAAEKIDRTRGVAATALARLLRSMPTPVAAQIPHVDALNATFAESSIAGGAETSHSVAVRFATPATAFPALCALLPLPTYRPALVTGLLVSLGGITDSLAVCASKALASVLLGQPAEQHLTRLVIEDVLAAMTAAPRTDRVVIPALRTLDKLYATASFATCSGDDDVASTHASVLAACVREACGCRDVTKLCAMAPVFAHLADVPPRSSRGGGSGADIHIDALRALCDLMAGPYPRVRRAAAEGLYLRSLADDDGDGSGGTGLEAILVDARWDGTAKEVGDTVRRLFDALHLGDPPQDLGAVLLGPGAARAQRGAGTATRGDEHSSYASLVESAGY
jgi:tubulin-specific chaperone D